MKFIIVFACALAAVSAGYIAPVAYGVHAQHLPVIGPNGVPIDTPEVQHARAAHYAHKAEAEARNGDHSIVAHVAPVAYAHHDHHYAAPVYAHAAPVVAAHVAHGVVAHVGIPETPEVVAAKHAHFAAHAEALARNGHGHHLVRRGLYAAPVAAYVAPVHYAAQHLPIIGADGVPVDTAEVQHARAAHAVHKAHAVARNGDYHHDYHHAHPIVSAAYGAYPYSYGAYPYAHDDHHSGYGKYYY